MSPLATKSHSEELFNLHIEQHTQQTHILMKIFTPFITTKQIPHASLVLRTHLPNIFYSSCFNEKNLPFSQEVQNTELGHLFEHIMLEYLTQYKLLHHRKKVLFNGVTSWDLKKFGKGHFNIIIDIGHQDDSIFTVALKDAICLFKIILAFS